MSAIKRAARMMSEAAKVVALTGAGVSTESGIPDFRSAGGLWSRFDPFEYGTIGAFRDNPVKVWQMLDELLRMTDALPNDGHNVLAKFEQMNIVKGIITQNIDGLHQRAGSRNVVEFHGSLATFSCLACGKKVSLSAVRKQKATPQCEMCREILKPDVVFFDEIINPDTIAAADAMLHGADLLLVIGTSCQVAPASFIPQQVAMGGGKIVEINLEPTLAYSHAVLKGGFSKVMKELLDAVLLQQDCG